jgi:phenylalanyl-tRNA synthetase alpha chain
MPRLHPAREASFHVLDEAGRALAVADDDLEGLLPGVVAAHARGRGEPVDDERARRLVLRSHATALTTQLLAARRPLEGRYFTIVRCFRRPRQVDATHTADFFMIDCLAVGEELGFGHLLGLMRTCMEALTGDGEARFVPGYEPFVEPSVYLVKRGVDSRDFAGGGILRPEVTGPLGVDVPVLAFWLGLNRIAMELLGLTDVRHLYPASLGTLRALPSPIPSAGVR